MFHISTLLIALLEKPSGVKGWKVLSEVRGTIEGFEVLVCIFCATKGIDRKEFGVGFVSREIARSLEEFTALAIVTAIVIKLNR